MLLRVVGNCCSKSNESNVWTNKSQQFVLWSPKRSAAILEPFGQLFQHCGATHLHYAWFTKTYRLYPSHDALQVPTSLGVVVFVCMLLKKIGRQRILQIGVSFYVIFSFNYFEFAAIKVLLIANGPRRIHSENRILFAFLTHFIRVIAMNISIPSRSHRCHDPINCCTVTGEGGRVQQTCSKETAKPM